MKIVITIPYVSWRGGRPRFTASPALLRAGVKTADLRHPDGRWFTAEEARAWVDAALPKLAEARAKRGKARREAMAAVVDRRLGLSLADIEPKFFASEAVVGARDGKRVVEPLAANTIAGYRQSLRLFAEDNPELYATPLVAIDVDVMDKAFKRSWSRRGHASAHAMMRAVRLVINWAMRARLVTIAANPAASLKMETPPTRLRAATREEIEALVAAADAIGRPEIGDAILLGVWTGQRQADRLALVDAPLVDGRYRRFKQAKTGAIVEIPAIAPTLEARLRAAKARRSTWGAAAPAEIVVDEATRKPFADRFAYNKRFVEVRAKAVEALPSLADFTDQDLRDTAVTWLGRAGCTLVEIAAVTGHSLQSITDILKHYLSLHRSSADAALEKLLAWDEKEKARG